MADFCDGVKSESCEIGSPVPFGVGVGGGGSVHYLSHHMYV